MFAGLQELFPPGFISRSRSFLPGCHEGRRLPANQHPCCGFNGRTCPCRPCLLPTPSAVPHASLESSTVGHHTRRDTLHAPAPTQAQDSGTVTTADNTALDGDALMTDAAALTIQHVVASGLRAASSDCHSACPGGPGGVPAALVQQERPALLPLLYAPPLASLVLHCKLPAVRRTPAWQEKRNDILRQVP